MKGLLFILSAPSGAGKTTVCEALLSGVSNLRRAITTTTRPPRPGEVNGVDYFFLSKDEFQRKIGEEQFLEYAVIYDNYYGSGRDYIESELEAGHDVILVVDVQGACSIKKTDVPAVYIYLLPPSLEVLRSRLVEREMDTPEVIEKRFSQAKKELSRYTEYDYCIINEDLSEAVADINAIIRAERCRVKYYTDFINKIIKE